MKHPLSRSSLLGALGATAALVAVAVALGRGGDSSNDATTAATATTAPSNSGSAGLMVAKDPVTGALRAPTAEEIAALQSKGKAEAARQRGAAPVLRRLRNGASAITIDPSFDLYSIAAKGPDGKVRTACLPGEKVETALQAARPGDMTTEEVLDEK